MGDKVVKKINEISIIDGVNGEKGPLSLLKKKLPSRMVKEKAMWTQILANEGYGIHTIEIWNLFLLI